MSAPLTIVINPAAGGGAAARSMAGVSAVLDGAGVRYTVLESKSLDHARSLAAAAAEGGDTVVAFGGDGLTGALAGAIARPAPAAAGDTTAPGTTAGDASARDIAAGDTTARDIAAGDTTARDIAAGDTTARGTTAGDAGARDDAAGAGGGAAGAGGGTAGTFGVIPCGRGNDFARAHGIPFDPPAAARVLAEGTPRPVDLIEVTRTGHAGTSGETVIVAGSVYPGIAAVAGEIANQARLIRGPIVYNLAALRALLGWKPTVFRLEVTSPGGEHTEREFRGYAVVAANIPYFGAGMKVAPDAHFGDGLLDVVLMRHAPKLTFVRALMKIKDGSHVNLDQIEVFRARSVTVSTDRPVPAGADGELLDCAAPLPAGSRLCIRAIPEALRLIVPR